MTGQDYRNTTVVVVDFVDHSWVVWQVATKLQGSESRLAGAWRFPAAELDTLEALLWARQCWATKQAADSLIEGLVIELPLDADAARQMVVDRVDEVRLAFESYAASRPSRLPAPVTPNWPVVPPPLDVEGADVGDRTGRALRAARWFSELAMSWDRIEGERTRGNRVYLHDLGGSGGLPFPMPTLLTVT